MGGYECRSCRDGGGEVVLDLGQQRASAYFPKYDDRKPDPVYPLQMWLCANCGLAQLLTDPTVPEEPRGAEPAVLVAQAADAAGRGARTRPTRSAGAPPPGCCPRAPGSPSTAARTAGSGWIC